jgi:hypothetical protein
MRIERIADENRRMQGVARRAWYAQHSPAHLEGVATVLRTGWAARQAGTPPDLVVLGAGACTEAPPALLLELASQVTLVDIDGASMAAACAEVPPAQRARLRIVEGDIAAGVSARLADLVAHQDWPALIAAGPSRFWSVLAACLIACPVSAPAQLPLPAAAYGLVASTLVLTQLFNLPLMDLLDHAARLEPDFLGEQEEHAAYQYAVADFKRRVTVAHLDLLAHLLAPGGAIALISDVEGFLWDAGGSRTTLPLFPFDLAELLATRFTPLAPPLEWEWLTHLPAGAQPGRGYRVQGWLLGGSS